ncbi:hypothetical protein HHO41_09105 [Bacillus sp. DNRA2]|uniref:hypothetical protein n=1 Tax=Bacillus sp. DNRA2 TaxID=2723053 RepID=UPI00145E2407|nr:hypothetical protein [Bacillus sp. DNRA2]NMD70449.1 hypothetical protein [Bacillus sp. DNRA2]
MAAKKEENKLINVMDVFWDGWFNSYRTFHTIQNEVEEKSIQAFESQKEWIRSTGDQLTKMEEDSKRLTTEWITNLQDVLSKAQLDFGFQNTLDWTDRVEELGHKAQTLAFTPGKNSLEVAERTLSQLEETFKNVIDQQQKNREEVLKAVEGFLDQLKQSQATATKQLELYNPLVAK